MQLRSAILSVCLVPIAGISVTSLVVRHNITGALAPSSLKPVTLPLDLVRLSSDCSCQFLGYCTCEGAQTFMMCIQDACNKSSCNCEGSYHFEQACGEMAITCPRLGLTCSSTEATCSADPVQVTPTDAGASAASTSDTPHQTPVSPGPPVVVGPYAMLLTWGTVISLVQCLIILVFAFVYNKHRWTMAFGVRRGPQDQGTFRFGLFTCFQSQRLCLMGCFCPCLRWPDTVEKALQSPSYWLLVAVIIFFTFFDLLSHGLCSLMLALLGCIMRQRMRRSYRMKNSGTVLVLDLLTWCCCTPCAVVQEARYCELTRHEYKQQKSRSSA